MNKVFLYIYIFLYTLILLFGMFFINMIDLNIYIGTCSIATIFLFILLYFVKEPNSALRGKVKFIFLFLLGYSIVFYQNYLDLLFNYESLSNIFIFGKNEFWLKYAIIFISLCLNMYVLGYLIKMNIRLKVSEKIKIPNEYLKLDKRVFILNILAAIFLALYYSSVDIKYLLGGYGGVELGAAAIRYSLVFKALIFSSFIIKTISKGNLPVIKYIKLFIPELILIIVYLIGVITSGDRGPILTFGLMFFVGLVKNTKFKASKLQLILTVFFFANLITVLGEARKLSYDNLSFIEKVSLTLSDESPDTKSIFSPTKELAGSFNTLIYSIDYIENGNNIFYGRFFLQQILVGVPFTSQNVNVLLFGVGHSETFSSAHYVTYIIQGNDATYGNGTSLLADLYLDFGFFISLIIMFTFGILSRFIDVNIYGTAKNLFSYAFSIVYFTSSIYISRSAILMDFQTVIWIMIIITFYRILLKNRII